MAAFQRFKASKAVVEIEDRRCGGLLFFCISLAFLILFQVSSSRVSW